MLIKLKFIITSVIVTKWLLTSCAADNVQKSENSDRLMMLSKVSIAFIKGQINKKQLLALC